MEGVFCLILSFFLEVSRCLIFLCEQNGLLTKLNAQIPGQSEAGAFQNDENGGESEGGVFQNNRNTGERKAGAFQNDDNAGESEAGVFQNGENV